MQVTKEMYDKVCKWTKNVDVFDMDYILIPIHDAAHWSLAIVCHPGADPSLSALRKPIVVI